MRKRIDSLQIDLWVGEVGGAPAATTLITNALGCSYSKAQKIALGVYQYGLSLQEQRALSKLTNRKPAILFLSADRRRAS